MRRGFAFYVLLVGVLTCVLPVALDASLDYQDDVKKEVRRYEGKLLLLKTPSSFDIVHFDQQGRASREPSGVPWTTSGLVRARKTDVRERQVVIDGVRVVVALDPESPIPKLVPVTTDREVHVTIQLPSSLHGSAELNDFLSRVFSVEDVPQRIANAWHAEIDLKRLEDIQSLPPDGRIGTLEGGRVVYSWESGVVTKPRALYKPGPSYPASALLKRVSGNIRVRVIVNEKGFPEILEIIQNLREGLDAQVLAAVSQWRFEIPRKDGIPAATMVVVEIKFHLRNSPPPRRR
jgi:TonB family protein